ncbi:STAS domain-containing protein [Thermoproteota archaeon]
MEVNKSEINEKVTKVEIGAAFQEEDKKINGAVELDLENQGQFVEIINSLLDEGHSQIIVDMRNISYIDSSGLWALFEGHKKATQSNGKLVLLKPTKDVKRVLDITKMSAKIEIYDDEKKAVETFTVQ